MGLEYSPAQQMGKSCESMQPSGSSTDVVCRRARRGYKETQLGCCNQTTASAESENCECKREYPQEQAWMLDNAAPQG
jgi:hypothetical protein